MQTIRAADHVKWQRGVFVHMPTSDDETADMEITLPAKLALQVRAGHGDVTVQRRQAPVDVSANMGTCG